MRALVTGASRGIGFHLTAYLKQKGFDVMGCSRQSGHDISVQEDRLRLAEMSLGYDYFVNCAHAGWSQVDLLFEVARVWKENRKRGTLLSIGSRAASDFRLRPNPIPYDHQKVALRSAHEAFSVDSAFRGVLLELGYVENCSTIPQDYPYLKFEDLEPVYDLIFGSDPGLQLRHILVERLFPKDDQ